MRFVATLVLSLLASIVSGINVPGLPKCAGDCVTNLGGCKLVQVKCICTNQPLLAELSCCIHKSCSAADQKEAIKFADAICAGQKVTNLPTTATCASTASATSSSAAAASTTSSNSNSNAGNSGKFEGAGLGLLAAGLMAAL